MWDEWLAALDIRPGPFVVSARRAVAEGGKTSSRTDPKTCHRPDVNRPQHRDRIGGKSAFEARPRRRWTAGPFATAVRRVGGDLVDGLVHAAPADVALPAPRWQLLGGGERGGARVAGGPADPASGHRVVAGRWRRRDRARRPRGRAGVAAQPRRDGRRRPAHSCAHDQQPRQAQQPHARNRAATKPIVVLSDSDTLWEPALLRNLLRPFADPAVGGVGTRQRVLDPGSSVWRRAADWILDAKYLTYVPAMARRGGVSCLSGRTVAYRRDVLMEVLPGLMGETFWGRRCVSGDDGRLTWLVLNAGYRTTYQQDAVAWTMMPDSARGFLQQRIRWSRNSYRCYVRAIFRGWLFRQPAITRVSVLQGLLAPVSLMVGLVFVSLAIARGDFVATAVW